MSLSTSGWAEILSPRYLSATTTLCLGVALLAFNTFLATVALPSAVTELGGLPLLSWATTLFLVFAIMGGAAAANLKARLGARRALLAAALVFILGSLLAGLAQSMPELLVGRALQGLGEGVVAAICYALIPELFPSILVPKVFGAEAVVWALAAFGGPVLAGFLTETLSWRAAFLVNLPIGIIFMALTLLAVPRAESSYQETERLPYIRLLLIGAAIMAVSVGGVLANPGLTALCLGAAALALYAIVRRDETARERLFPSRAFTLDDIVGAGLWVILLMPVAQSAIAVYLIFALQALWGLGPLHAGLVSAVMAIFWSLTAIAVAGVQSPQGRMRLIVVGPALLVSGLVIVASGFSLDSLWAVIAGQVSIGMGFGASWAYLSQTIMEAARPGERDRASALLPTIQSAGYGIGAAIAGLVANSFGLAGAVSGLDIKSAIVAVVITGAGLSVFALLAALAMTRRMRLATGPARI